MGAAGVRRSVGVVVTLCLVAALAVGCGGGNGEEGPAAVTLPPYPSELSAASTPSQVAQVLIRGLDEGDGETLMGLVAVESAVEAMDGIYRDHGREHETPPEQAAALVVSGWRASYAFYRSGGTRVVEERVRGETAVVTAEGSNATTGKRRLLTADMIREDGVWKVQAGLQSREP
jgi:hypothetical protein